MNDAHTPELLKLYSQGEMPAPAFRGALGGASFGDVLIGPKKRDLRLPRATRAGCEQRLAEAGALPSPDVLIARSKKFMAVRKKRAAK
ncbi:MAG TPA: hypothetical protein VGI20_12115 [Rhizomicrobium sp.]